MPANITDNYQTLDAESISEYKEKGSKFLAYAQAVHTPQEVKDFLERIKMMHPKATHHCYAYRLGMDKQKHYRANDDGEPSGTAGKPILGQIDSKGLSNCMAIVVRYYGGTKLGVPGLIRSYKTACRLALDEGKVVTKYLANHYQLHFDYVWLNEVMRIVKREKLATYNQVFHNSCSLFFSIRQAESARIVALFEQLRHVEIKYAFTA